MRDAEDATASRGSNGMELGYGLADESLDALAAIRPDGVVLLWNRAAEKLLGHSRGDASGHEFDELLAGSDALPRAALRAAVARTLEAGAASLEMVRWRGVAIQSRSPSRCGKSEGTTAR
jgi:PAS domain-containing protein